MGQKLTVLGVILNNNKSFCYEPKACQLKKIRGSLQQSSRNGMGIHSLDHPPSCLEAPSANGAAGIIALTQRQRGIGRQKAAEAIKSHNPY